MNVFLVFLSVTCFFTNYNWDAIEYSNENKPVVGVLDFDTSTNINNTMYLEYVIPIMIDRLLLLDNSTILINRRALKQYRYAQLLQNNLCFDLKEDLIENNPFKLSLLIYGNVDANSTTTIDTFIYNYDTGETKSFQYVLSEVNIKVLKDVIIEFMSNAALFSHTRYGNMKKYNFNNDLIEYQNCYDSYIYYKKFGPEYLLTEHAIRQYSDSCERIESSIKNKYHSITLKKAKGYWFFPYGIYLNYTHIPSLNVFDLFTKNIYSRYYCYEKYYSNDNHRDLSHKTIYALGKVLELNPVIDYYDEPLIVHGLTIALREAPKSEETYNILEKYNSVNWIYCRQMARQMKRYGYRNRYIEYLNKSLIMNPYNYDTYELLSNAYLEQNDKEKAKEYLKMAVESIKIAHPDNEELLKRYNNYIEMYEK